MDSSLKNDLPALPPKRLFYNREQQFLENRMRGLNEYLKMLIGMYEAISHPSFQKFLAIDSNFSPNYEYEAYNKKTNIPR